MRRLTTKNQLIAMLFGQLAGAESLREIVLGLGSHAARLYHETCVRVLISPGNRLF